MSKKKQIEEMAKELCGSTMCDLETYNRCRMPRGNCSRCQRVAEDLYNAGYRKQSEVVKAIADFMYDGEIEGLAISMGGAFLTKNEFIDKFAERR